MASAPQDLVPWFQMASTIIAGAGIVASTLIGLSALNGNRRERRDKILPNLLFTPGGETARIALTDEWVFPGRDASDLEVRGFLANLPADSRRIVLREPVGELSNYGSGPAMNIKIVFLPERIQAEGGWRELSAGEKASFAFKPDSNEIIPAPAHLATGKSGSMGVLPGAVCFMLPDADAVSGKAMITCKDAQGIPVTCTQEMAFSIVAGSGKKASAPSLAISFGDRILDIEPPPRWSLLKRQRAVAPS